MARFLALDWDQQQLHIVSASVKHTQLTVHRAVVSKEATVPNLGTAEQLGQRLRELLKAERIAPAPVFVCVGRDRVILKEVTYPPVPAAEEAAIVRFQALKELTHAPEEVVIDYHTSSEAGPKGERRAMVVILRRELLDTYQALCRAAGLKLAGITPRPFGTAACLQRVLAAPVSATPPELAAGAVAVLTVADQWAEFCVVQNGILHFARAMAAPAAGAEAALLGDIRRNLAVYAGQSPHSAVRALYLADSGARGTLRELLQNTLAVPVHLLDPFLGESEPPLAVDRRGSFASTVGILQAQANFKAIPINFVAPKEPKPVRDPNRLRIAAAAVAAAVVLLGTAVFAYSSIVSYDRKIDTLNAQKIDVEGQLALLEEDDKRIKAIGDWVEGEVVWLDELYDLTERFPDGTAVRLTQLAGDSMTRNSKAKHTARLALKGVTTYDFRQVRQVDALLDRFAAAVNYYHVSAKKLDRNNTGIERTRFPQLFTAQIEVQPRKPNEYSVRLSAPVPERPKVGGEAGDDDAGAGGFGGFGGFGGGQR